MKATLTILIALGGAKIFAAPVDFEKEIQPILAKSCVACHNEQKAKGKVRLDRIDVAIKDRVIVPGNAKQSPLYQSISGGDATAMPPKGPGLTAAQIALIQTWIEQGAKAPAVKPNAVPANPPRRVGGREREREREDGDRRGRKERDDD